ncbi:hypothetical protein NCCP436_12010 [Pseudomonas sp. NCCP-436]|nr:hypothetical protein NCCP436_12010 [Pseudomonas sp. NCCP-436]
MSGSVANPLQCSERINPQVHERQIWKRLAQALTVGPFERRAGQHKALSSRLGRLHFLAQGIEPLLAIIVIERDSSTHAGDIIGTVEIIGFDMTPLQAGGDYAADVTLAGTADAHNH